MTLRNVDAAVIFKRAGLSRATVLDPNGYPRGARPLEETGGGLSLRLPPDALYTLCR